jgi:hypothetical protein
MVEAVYILCAATSALCAVLLLRAYARSRVRLLLWSALCFVGLTFNNALLIVDLVLVPEVDLSLWRTSSAFGAMAVLIYGLVWETR